MDFEKMYRQLDEFMKNKGNMSEEEALRNLWSFIIVMILI